MRVFGADQIRQLTTIIQVNASERTVQVNTGSPANSGLQNDNTDLIMRSEIQDDESCGCTGSTRGDVACETPPLCWCWLVCHLYVTVYVAGWQGSHQARRVGTGGRNISANCGPP